MARGSISERRSWVILLLLLVAFSALLFRIVNLSVLNRDFLKHQGDLRALRVDLVPAPRARILDRSGIPLAISIPMESIWLDPKAWQGGTKDVAHLAHALHVKKSILNKKVAHGQRRFVYLKRHADPAVVKAVRALSLPGIHFKKEYRRFYPKGEAMAHVLGITNIDDQGQEGVELAYNDVLSGKPGKRMVEKDRLGRIIAIKKTLSLGKKGQDVQLTLDSQLQEIAYECLLKGAHKSGATQGSVVILMPKTGEVLAMANYPSYNPNKGHRPVDKMRNQAITDLFEPGSTMKAFTAVHLLQSGLKPTTKVKVGNGRWLYQGKWVQDEHVDQSWLTLDDVLKHSSNVGIAKLSLETSSAALMSLLQSLGFGAMSFVGLPGEAPGSFEASIRDHAYSMAALSFGYGVSTTNLQLAHAYAILANWGHDVGVRIIKTHATLKGREVIREAIAKKVVAMLEHVVSRHGTGYKARVKGLRIAGKTGTAHLVQDGQYSNRHYTASFVGMLPAEDPEWVVSVVLQNPKRSMRFGAQSAAPVFADIVAKGWWLTRR